MGAIVCVATGLVVTLLVEQFWQSQEIDNAYMGNICEYQTQVSDTPVLMRLLILT